MASRACRVLAFLSIALIMLAEAGAGSALAGPRPRLSSPHTSVSSDGRIGVPSAELFGPAQVERAHRGSGRVTDDDAETRSGYESAADLSDLLALRATRGKVGIESVIGPDGRTRVPGTTAYPARAVVLITLSGARCTGWLYGPDVVATAGHCVHSGGPNGSWQPVASVLVYPGRNGASSPYGSCSARTLYSVRGWIEASNEQYDYGAIKLNCKIGNTVGWFGYFHTTASLNGLPTQLNGYPGDKPLQQWKATDGVRVSQARQVFYQNDTTGGMSGAPVFYNRSGCGQCAMAIHAYGLHGLPPHAGNNHGTRIAEPVFNNLRGWKNAP